MVQATGAPIAQYFAALDDPRIDRTKRHKLLDIVTIALCATICGADSWVDIELFGNCKEEWFKSFLEEVRGPDHPAGPRPKTQGVGQISFIVESMDALKDLYQRLLKEGSRIDNVVTHGISCSVYFFDPEDNRIELYYKTGYIVKQGFSRPIDLEKQSNEELLAFSKSFETSEGPFQGAKLPVGSA